MKRYFRYIAFLFAFLMIPFAGCQTSANGTNIACNFVGTTLTCTYDGASVVIPVTAAILGVLGFLTPGPGSSERSIVVAEQPNVNCHANTKTELVYCSNPDSKQAVTFPVPPRIVDQIKAQYHHPRGLFQRIGL